ncbi:MAG: nucleotidyltransferase family protein [Beijerinckiaceae bacterium]|nr:nucleotidyltransferase family protein [Beijerinckiaceae bacterium]
MVFAAGLGTRMRPVTNTLPKPMVKVAGRPLMDHALDRLAEAGVETAVVNVHWLPDIIIDHLRARTSPRIIISDEREKLLDQGGGIMKAMEHLGPGPFFICNTDAIWLEGPRSNLRRMIEAWDPETMDILLLVAASATSVGVDWPGDFNMQADGRLVKREERTVAPFVYSGFGIVKPELFAGETRDIFSLAPFFFDAAKRGRLHGLRLEGQWLHVGTPEAIEEAERTFVRSVL